MLSRVALIITDLNISAISTMEHQVPVKPALARTEHAATLASPSREKWLVLQHVSSVTTRIIAKDWTTMDSTTTMYSTTMVALNFTLLMM